MLAETIARVCKSARSNGCVGDHVIVSKKAVEYLDAVTPAAVCLEQAAEYLTRSMTTDEDLMGKTIRLSDQQYAALAVRLAEEAQTSIRQVPMKGLPFVPVYLGAITQFNPAGWRIGAVLKFLTALLEEQLPHSSIVDVSPGRVREESVRSLTADDVFPTMNVGLVVFVTSHGSDGYLIHVQALQDLDGSGFPVHDFEAATIRTYGGFSEAQEIARVVKYAMGA